jgi:hypothetical protein
MTLKLKHKTQINIAFTTLSFKIFKINTMKNILVLLMLSVAIIANATPSYGQILKNIINNKTTLPAGTLVILESTESLKTGQATVGQLVHFRVTTHVKADGDVVIATGAMGLGRIKSIDPSTYNNPETFHIEVTSVQAVDGQMVPLQGQELMMKGKFSSQEAASDAGKTITAYVTNDIKIKA